MCDCLIIGCTDNDTVLSRPPPGCSTPGQILCVYCGSRTDAVYKRNDSYFSVCFIPCCVVREGPTYLCCRFCKNDLGTRIDPCDRCGTASSISFNYCPRCGNIKDSDVGHRRIAPADKNVEKEGNVNGNQHGNNDNSNQHGDNDNTQDEHFKGKPRILNEGEQDSKAEDKKESNINSNHHGNNDNNNQHGDNDNTQDEHFKGKPRILNEGEQDSKKEDKKERKDTNKNIYD